MERTKLFSPRRGACVSLLGFAALTFGLTGCGAESTEPPVGSLPIAMRQTRPLRDVLDAKLKAYGVVARVDDDMARELRDDTGTMPAGTGQPHDQSPPERPATVDLDPELVEMRDGLVGMVVSDPRQLALARADVENLAAEMVPVLVAGLRDPARSIAELRVLADFAGATPHADLALALVELASDHDDPWMRRYAAWSLLPHAQADGADVVIPTLLRRLKYERDEEGFVWVAAALAAFGNDSGLPALFDLASRPAGDPIGDAARAQVAEIVAAAGTENGDVLWAEWQSGARGIDAGASEALRAELWLLVADLSSKHFQLRGVDDARHVISRLAPWAGIELAAALEDSDDHVRLHVAQCLERMGPRGRHAIDSLIAALGDESDAVAGAACDALAAVAGSAAEEPLLSLMRAKRSHEIKVAAVRAVGRIPGAPLERILAEFEAENATVDLRLAAAEGLVRGGRTAAVLPWLATALTDRFGDPAGAEALAETWVQDPGEDAARVELREAWRALAPPAAVIHTGEQVRKRRSQRAALLAAFTAR